MAFFKKLFHKKKQLYEFRVEVLHPKTFGSIEWTPFGRSVMAHFDIFNDAACFSLVMIEAFKLYSHIISQNCDVFVGIVMVPENKKPEMVDFNGTFYINVVKGRMMAQAPLPENFQQIIVEIARDFDGEGNLRPQ